MSTETGESQKLTYRLLFMRVDAEGNKAIQVANRPLLILAVAISIAIVLIALNSSYAEWQLWFSKPFSWAKGIFPWWKN